MSQLSERTVRRGTDPDVAAFIDEVVTFWNSGRYQAKVLSSAPVHTGVEGEFFFVNSGGTQSLYAWVGGGWKSEILT